MAAATCLPRETLKQYLVGDVEESQTEAIASHLASCPDCEQTVVELEANPDTLMFGIRALPAQQGKHEQEGKKGQQQGGSSDTNAGEEPSVVRQALAAVRQLPESSSKPLSEWPVGQIGAYELLRPLGRGGMGMVVLARHRSLQKEVAIKLLSSLLGDKPELVTRFQREMRAAGRLQHPAIVNATDAGQERGTHYLVMEFVAGLDLSRIARLVGRLSIADACELIRQTALGLSHAHAEGIVHRDVKPSNLMLDATGHVKILDFGLAQINLWDEPVCELTTVGQLMGTIDYMAPEQAERIGAVDYRADLYALGATLFRLIAGRAPLAASPNMTLLEKVRLLGSQTSPLLSSVREDCPAELVQLVSQLLSRDPAARPASAAHVAQALEPFCSGNRLVELLANAQAAAVAEPIAEPAVESAMASLAQPSSLQFTETVGASKTPIKPPIGGWLWTAAAALPLMILAGILITIETQKGQLVIQSDVADVQIKVARDGKVVDELTVHPGAQSTRLRADKYEILIDSPSDQVVVDKQQFSIKSGETVVATIKQIERHQGPQPLADNKLLSNSEELTYDGTSYSEWLRKLATDVSEEKQLESLNALYAIGERQQVEDTRPIILRVLKDMSQRRVVSSKLFSTSFGVLSKTFENQGLCDQFLAIEVKNGNEGWQSFIFESHQRVFSPAIPLIDVAKELVSQADVGRPKTIEAAGDYLFSCTRTFAATGDEASVSQLLDALERSPGLTMSFWIKNLHAESDVAFTETIKAPLARVASRALKNKISAEDGMRALLLMNRYGDSANLDWLAPYVSQLVDNPERISRFYQINQDTLSRAIIGKANGTFGLPIPNGEAIDLLRLACLRDLNSEQLAVVRRLLDATTNLLPNAKEWLKQDEDKSLSQTKFTTYLVRSQDAWNRLTETQRGLVVIATAASSLLPEFNYDFNFEIDCPDSIQVGQRVMAFITIRSNGTVSLPRMEVEINNDPELKAIAADSANQPQLRQEDGRVFWSYEGGDAVRKLAIVFEAVAVSDKATIHMKAASGDKVLGEATTSTVIPANLGAEGARPPLIEPNENRVEPLFDGRTLTQWLEILERDRDVTARLNAIKAIGSLAEKTAGALITERLIAIARQANPTDWSDYDSVVNLVKYGGYSTDSTLDSSLIELLVQLNSQEGFLKIVVDELLLGDDLWTARWLAALLKGQTTSRGFGTTIFERFKSQEAFNTLGPNSAWLANALLVQYIVNSEIDEIVSEQSNREMSAYVDADEKIKALRENIASHESDIRKIERKEQTAISANRYKSLKQELSSWKTQLAQAEAEIRAQAENALKERQIGNIDKRKLAIVEQVIKLIENQPHLGRLAVLKVDGEIGARFGRGNPGASRSQLMVEEAIARYAKAVLEDNDSSPEAVARAASRLASTTEIVEGWKVELLDVIRKRLGTLGKDLDRLTTILQIKQQRDARAYYKFPQRASTDGPSKLPIPVSNRFAIEPSSGWNRQPNPQEFIGALRGGGGSTVTSGRDAVQTWASKSEFRNIVMVPPYVESECVALIALMVRLEGALQCEEQLTLIAEATWPDFDSLMTHTGSRILTDPDQGNRKTEPWSKISNATWLGWAIHRELYLLFIQEKEHLPKLIPALNRTLSRLYFLQADQDNDGKLSSEELRTPEANLVDANKDGSLDFEEFRALSKQNQEAPKNVTITSEGMDWAKKHIARYDMNGDGKLNADEWSKMLVVPVGADTNGDGEMTVEEFLKFRQRR